MDEYIARPEPLYEWTELSHEALEGIDSYTLNVTTCTWLDGQLYLVVWLGYGLVSKVWLFICLVGYVLYCHIELTM